MVFGSISGATNKVFIGMEDEIWSWDRSTDVYTQMITSAQWATTTIPTGHKIRKMFIDSTNSRLIVITTKDCQTEPSAPNFWCEMKVWTVASLTAGNAVLQTTETQFMPGIVGYRPGRQQAVGGVWYAVAGRETLHSVGGNSISQSVTENHSIPFPQYMNSVGTGIWEYHPCTTISANGDLATINGVTAFGFTQRGFYVLESGPGSQAYGWFTWMIGADWCIHWWADKLFWVRTVSYSDSTLPVLVLREYTIGGASTDTNLSTATGCPLAIGHSQRSQDTAGRWVDFSGYVGNPYQRLTKIGAITNVVEREYGVFQTTMRDITLDNKDGWLTKQFYENTTGGGLVTVTGQAATFNASLNRSIRVLSRCKCQVRLRIEIPGGGWDEEVS